MGNTGPIVSGQNVTPRFSMCSISTNSLTVLVNFLGIQNSIFSKNIGRDHGNTIQATTYTYHGQPAAEWLILILIQFDTLNRWGMLFCEQHVRSKKSPGPIRLKM